MIGGTNLTLLSRALRGDGLILKPAYAAHRIDRFYVNGSGSGLWPNENNCGGAEVWSAPTLPARANLSARHDRRANSMARLFSLSAIHADDSSGVWWYSLLSWDTSDSNCSLSAAELSPPAKSGRGYVVSLFGTRCDDGAPATSCVQKLAEGTPRLLVATNTSGTGLSTDIRVHHVAPVLSRGWVLLGEQDKYVAVSPQRFMAAYPSMSPHAADISASDALIQDELLSEDGDSLTFLVMGEPDEIVDVVVITPAPRVIHVDQLTTTDDVDVLSGTVAVVKVVVGPTGRSRVECVAGKSCTSHRSVV